ncbi:MAG: histidine kinase, partial [Methylobacterium sp.]|nr:histidine kinase [Methylobacterium sp.]
RGGNEIAVAQRATLFEETGAQGSQPRAIPAQVVWRLDAVNAGQGQPLQTVVRAEVEAQEAGLSLSLVIRRNTDAALPASHVIELTFTPTDPARAVRDVGLLQFKDDESGRGSPVSGLPVPVRENLFLIGLSNLKGDVERNTDLLLRRNWIDLPLRYASNTRAILTFEKGSAGERVMREAFAQWQ